MRATGSSMSSTSSGSSHLPSAQTSPKKKASPSDVIFGAPPGADDLSRKYDSLNSHSAVSPHPDASQAADSSGVSSIDSSSSRSQSDLQGLTNGRGANSTADAGRSSLSPAAAAAVAAWNKDGPRALTQNSQTSTPGSSGASQGGSSGSINGTVGTTVTAGTAVSMAEDAASGRAQPLGAAAPLGSEDGNVQVKLVPALLEDADAEDIVVLVADMLARLIAHNDLIPLHPSSLTRFHSRATPAISISSYLRRIARYTSLDKACALILLVYIDRVCARMDGFTICGLTVHRFVCAAVVCASKALCDAFSTNGHYARVGGISLVELNMLEKEFLTIIDWRLTCSGALLQHYYTSLVRSHAGFRLQGDAKGDLSTTAPTTMDVDS